jgi:hypothetical protein
VSVLVVVVGISTLLFIASRLRMSGSKRTVGRSATGVVIVVTAFLSALAPRAADVLPFGVLRWSGCCGGQAGPSRVRPWSLAPDGAAVHPAAGRMPPPHARSKAQTKVRTTPMSPPGIWSDASMT